MIESNFRYWVGGKKKNGGHFAYFEGGRMRMGSNHVPMSKNERNRRYFVSGKIQKGIKNY